MDRRQQTKWDRGESPNSPITDADKIAIGATYKAELKKGQPSEYVVEELGKRYGRSTRQIYRYISEVSNWGPTTGDAADRHWEDLRQTAGQITSRIKVGTDEEGRWSVTVPRPKSPSERLLWEDLKTHTPEHEAWGLLDNFEDQCYVFRDLREKARILRKSGKPTTQRLREVQQAVVERRNELRELRRQVIDSLAPLQLRHEFHGIRCPDCPSQTLDST